MLVFIYIFSACLIVVRRVWEQGYVDKKKHVSLHAYPPSLTYPTNNNNRQNMQRAVEGCGATFFFTLIQAVTSPQVESKIQLPSRFLYIQACTKAMEHRKQSNEAIKAGCVNTVICMLIFYTSHSTMYTKTCMSFIFFPLLFSNWGANSSASLT